jgi:hypothetical protein
VGHDGGGEAPGRIVIANNTLDGGYNRTGAIAILATGESRQQRFEIHNNILSNLSRGNALIVAEYEPAKLRSNSNVFDRRGFFRWGGEDFFSVETWRRGSSQDGSSRACSPRFVDRSQGDLHLDWRDRCARDSGEDLDVIPGRDIDGETRGPDDPWDVGADEVSPLEAPLEPLSRAGPGDRSTGDGMDDQAAGTVSATVGAPGPISWSGSTGVRNSSGRRAATAAKAVCSQNSLATNGIKMVESTRL